MSVGVAGPGRSGRDPLAAIYDGHCCWPKCSREVGPIEAPLCGNHLVVAWRYVNDTFHSLWDRPLDLTEPPARPGHVYFVRFRDRVKIGFSTDVVDRLRAIPHDAVLAIVPGTRLDERRCHAAFADLRVQGEWFRAEPRLIEFASELGLHEEAQLAR